MASGIRIEGLDDVIKKLNELGKLSELVEYKVRPELEAFKDSIRNDQMSGRPGLNVQTGTLRDSFDVEVVEAADTLELIAGSDVEYIVYHQYGTPDIPKRLYINEEWEQFVEHDLIQTIEEAALEILERQ